MAKRSTHTYISTEAPYDRSCRFVSALHIPTWDSTRLVSGGGDPEIKLWGWITGKLIAKYDVENAVLPFVKVVRGRSGGGDASGDEGEGEGEKQLTKAQKRKLRRKKGKGKDAAADSVVPDENDDVSNMDVDNPATPIRAVSATAGDENEKQPVLAISKIESLETSSHKLCFFCAIGYVLIFVVFDYFLTCETERLPYSISRCLLRLQKLRSDIVIWVNLF